LWILLIWGGWIAVWLAIFGPKMIKTVWGEITELDQIRAFCIALSAAITVIIASQLGLPVSSTHIALGWVFWVGFLREFLHKREHGKKEKFVERSMLKKIIAAWLITVPTVALLSWVIFMILNNVYINMG
jgi:PiT family inorganic phosphate transporter